MKKSAATQLKDSGIRIIEVRVRNFRSLRSVDVELDRVTVLVGQNNSGKTSLLDAMYAAMGGVRQGMGEEDVFLVPGEAKVPRERCVLIDILIRPCDSKGQVLDSFPYGSYWTGLWGTGIAQDELDRDFMAFRTSLKWNEIKNEYKVERHFLREWLKDSSQMEKAELNKKAGYVNPSQIEPMLLYLMDAKRDIEEDMRWQRSIWGRLTTDLGLSDEEIKEIESILSDLNEKMLDESEVLGHLKDHLDDLNLMVSGAKDGVEIAPVARRLRDLAKGVGLNFTSEGSQTFPLARHGMGTRSLASILVFRAFVAWRCLKAVNDSVHPFLALEEPEAHLHPQAQRALFHQLIGVPGQVIVSTHSPYVAGQADIEWLRHFRKVGAETLVTSFDRTKLSNEDLGKIKSMVLSTRGDVLFSRAVILLEGTTEESCLPVFAESYWGQDIHLSGVSFVGVGGDGSYTPFLRFAAAFGIPWYIFSDGGQLTQKRLLKHLKKIGISDLRSALNVVIIPNEENLEEYFVLQGYDAAIESMLNKFFDRENYVEDVYIKKHEGEKRRDDTVRLYSGTEGRKKALIDALSSIKAHYGRPLAKEILTLDDEKRRYPDKIRCLLELVKKEILERKLTE